jgi:hypothetical protein
VKIRFYFDESDGTYGYRRVAAELARAGESVHPTRSAPSCGPRAWWRPSRV